MATGIKEKRKLKDKTHSMRAHTYSLEHFTIGTGQKKL